MFFIFCDFLSYFLSDFLLRDLRSLSSIPSMNLGARTSLTSTSNVGVILWFLAPSIS
jgi:hypothetical protein